MPMLKKQLIAPIIWAYAVSNSIAVIQTWSSESEVVTKDPKFISRLGGHDPLKNTLET